MPRPGLAGRQHLLQWADTLAAQSELPRLIRKLILETGRGVVELGFPAGEGVSAGDWDGTVRTTEATPFIPLGLSLWELSVAKGIKAKADSDYDKRISTPDDSPTAECTYVELILRPWTERRTWAKERTAEERWRQVVARGVDDVETWLEDAPVTHAWISEVLSLGPYGLRAAASWWEGWSNETNPELEADLVLAGRRRATEDLLASLEGTPSITTVLGGSLEEVLAFAAAVAVSATSEDNGQLLARMAFVDDVATWRSLQDHPHALVLVPVTEEVVSDARGGSSHHVLVPVVHGASADVELPPIAADDAATAFKATGMSDGDADRAGALARRSLLALRRSLAMKPELHTPAWAKPPLNRAIRGVLLAGQWSGAAEGDQEVIAALVGATADELRETLEGLASEADPIVSTVGEAWGLVSPYDAWLLLRAGLAEADLKRLEAAVRAVLLESDPALEYSAEERWRASFEGKTLRHSGDLREGLATSLALLGAMGEEIDAGKGTSYANYLVRILLEKANEDRSGLLWSSLSRQLPLLAEAAPDAFLEAVRDGTQGDDPVLREIFQDTEQSVLFASNSPHSGLLWALEGLAWSPDHFGQVANLLAKLTTVDPGGRLDNRPEKSLGDIFCPWYPENSVDNPRRLDVVDGLRERYPDVAWKLMLSMLPDGHGIHMPTHEPRFRDWKPPRTEVDSADYVALVDEITTRLIEDADDQAARWCQLIDEGSDLPVAGRKAIREGIAAVVELGKLTSEGQHALWEKIREFIARHREFSDANWAFPEVELKELEISEQALAPRDAAARTAWLFESDMPDLGDGSAARPDDFEKYTKELNSRRQRAVAEVESDGGLDDVIALAKAGYSAAIVGDALAETVGDRYEDAMLDRMRASDEKEVQFAIAYLIRRFRTNGWSWLEGLVAGEGLRSQDRGLLLMWTRDYPKAWEVAENAGSEVEDAFWTAFIPTGLGADFAAVHFVGTKLLGVKRPAAVLRLATLYMRRAKKSGEGESSEIAELAADALEVLSKEKDPDFAGLHEYDLQLAFDHLEDHKDSLGEERVARLEWAYLQALGFEPKVGTLHAQLAASPEFFVEVISALYKPHSEEASKLNEDQERVALNAHRLLSSWRTVPGSKNGKLDAEELKTWVAEAQEKLSNVDRREAGDTHIGHVLAFGPSDSDGAWPGKAVRDLLEELQNPDVEGGLRTQIFNNRGITSRAIDTGGEPERELANKYQEDGRRFADRWPRTASVLRDLATTYERDATRFDAEVERRRQGLDQ